MPKQPKCSQVEKRSGKTCHLLARRHTAPAVLLSRATPLDFKARPPPDLHVRPALLPPGWSKHTHSPRDLPVFLSRLTHHAVPVVSPVPVEVGQVTVLVPPGTAVGQSAVTQGNVIIQVNSGPGTALVIRHSIACRTRTNACVCVCGLLHVCLSWNKLFLFVFFGCFFSSLFPSLFSTMCKAALQLYPQYIQAHVFFGCSLFTPSSSNSFVSLWQRKSNKMPNIEQSIARCTL